MAHTVPPRGVGTLCSMLAAAIGSLSAPALLGVPAWAIGALGAPAQAQDDRETNRRKAETLRAMSRRITLDVEGQPLEDIFVFLQRVTGADLEPVYRRGVGTEGMDPSTPITLRLREVPALAALERVIEHAEREDGLGAEYTWQFTNLGTLQCGPKSELNRESRIEIYDIADLLLVIPEFDNAPDFNLQQSGGGGGGQSPFSGSSDDIDLEPQGERAQRLVDLIQLSVEPAQWASAGGSGARLTVYNTSLVIDAPDYIHRQIGGYEFWPARLQRARTREGRREMEVRADPRFAEPRDP